MWPITPARRIKVKITKRKLIKIIKEATSRFAPTAQQEAEKINREVGPGLFGMTLVTDQDFWEKQGIITGEDLALSLLSQSYSDYHKEVHGVRPRGKSFSSVEEVELAMSSLDNVVADMLEKQSLDVQQRAAVEKEREELEALMPNDLDFEDFPMSSGMGRRTESRDLSLGSRSLRKIIREALKIDVQKGDVILTGRFKDKRTVVKDIGKDEYGHPTINGKSILRFKIEKLLPKKDWSKKSKGKKK
jgi:hypothetical protein